MSAADGVQEAQDAPVGFSDTGGSRRRRTAWVAGVVAVAPAVLVSAALFGWMWQRSAAGVNTAGLQMPAMDLQHRVAYWWPFLMGETLGISALVWSYFSVLVGLAVFARASWLGIGRARLNQFHRYVSLTSLLLIAGHVLFVAVGGMNGAMTVRTVDVAEAVLPFQTSWNGVYYDTGVFAFYLALLLGPTYYLRRRIGVRGWRVAHRAALAVYVLAVWHTFGFDDFDFHGPYRLALWIAQLPLAVLLLWRLVAPAGAGRRAWRAGSPRGLATLAVAGVAGVLVAVVASGRTGGSASPFGSPAASTSPMSMSASMSMRLLPVWLAAAWVIALGVVWLLHLRHARCMPGPARWWHGGHMAMAAGMIVMYLVPQAGHGRLYEAGVVVFAALSLTTAVWCVIVSRRRGGAGWLWAASTGDMAVMAYMCMPMRHQPTAISYLLVAYLGAELLVWLIGSRERDLAVQGHRTIAGAGAAPDAAPLGATVGGSGSSTMTAVATRPRAGHGGVDGLRAAGLTVGVRVTLAIMSASMAWMLIAMLGVRMAASGMPTMPMP